MDRQVGRGTGSDGMQAPLLLHWSRHGCHGTDNLSTEVKVIELTFSVVWLFVFFSFQKGQLGLTTC